ncbi:MAG: ABC transporter substrate-binding protein [Cyclobacteriaceae bacterium]
MTRLLLIVVSCLLFACSQTPKNDSSRSNTLKYARGFRITEERGYTLVEVSNPYPQSSISLKYIVVKRGDNVPAHNNDTEVIFAPVEKMVCTSTSHVGLLDQLGAEKALIGFPTTDLISSKKIRARVDSGLVADLGIDSEMNLELLYSLKPELVMGYSISGDMVKLSRVSDLGIPVVINAEYLEDHPLGRAEWIKFMAVFLGKEKKADSIFDEIEKEYYNARSLVGNNATKPTAISGILYGDAWFLPGGQNYAAKMLADAGYHYLWQDDSSSDFLKLDFESVYAKGVEAEYWIGVGSFNSLNEMKAAEQRYELFTAFKQGNVYTYDARRGPTGGSEYFELGYARPDIVLKDLIKIANPGLLPNYELYFHKRLE